MNLPEAIRNHIPTRNEALSVPNAISLGGFALVCAGARVIDTKPGVAMIAAGRTLDVVDGFAARKLNQSSDFGAIVDATLDKAGMAVILTQAWRQDAAPKAVITEIALRNGLNMAATGIFTMQHPDSEPLPLASGKIAMAAETASLFAYLSENACEKGSRPQQIFRGLGHAAFGASLATGIPSTVKYIQGEFGVAGENSPYAAIQRAVGRTTNLFGLPTVIKP